ncbi:MAG TPA: 5,6-dimethylbenzimidazole synthase, partial [Candidatus Elarobacter sp.]
ERAAVYRAIRSRRDVRADFTDEPVEDGVLTRILEAAHRAPSVGLSQPWRFIVVRDLAARREVRDAFDEANAAAAQRYEGEQRTRYLSLRLQGILEAPLNLLVLCDDDPERGQGLGRQTMPETARYSTVCAIQNLWLAARVEQLGVGWVSIVDPQALRRIFAVPDRLRIVAYLCVGYVRTFADEPDLVRAGWEGRVPLEAVVDYERFGAR